MKLTCVIILMALMQVSAATFGQNLTLKEDNVSISKIFFEIRKQTGYDVLVKSNRLNTSRKINASFSDAPINDVLDKLIEGTGLDYTFNKRVITIKMKEASLLERMSDRFQAIDVTGKIIDENGQPIAGATVKVKGTTNSTASDGNGVFLLKNISDDAVLQISYLGYQVKEVKASKDLGSLKMELSIGKLEEVTVNAGYYRVKEREATGSISRITSKDIDRQPVNNVLATMQGRMAGVEIIQDSGNPLGGFRVKIRGQNSLRSSANEPLYIIDGIPYSSEIMGSNNTSTALPSPTNPLSNINSSDIESIELLKDADATAIYGSRGANGVVLISTKRAKAGKTSFNFLASRALGKVTRFFDLMNTEQYLNVRKEAFKNDGISVYPVAAYDINGTWDQNRYTDWQKELIGGTAQIQNYNGNVSGGSESTQFLLSANFRKETSVQIGDAEFKKGGLHFNVNHASANKKFDLVFSANYNLQKNNQPSSDLSRIATSLAPNAPELYDSQGKVNWENGTFMNPIAPLASRAIGDVNDLVANTVLSYKILPGLSLKSSFGMTSLQSDEKRKEPATIYNPGLGMGSESSTLFVSNVDRKSWIIEPQITWDVALDKTKLNFLLGGTAQSVNNTRLQQSGTGFSSDSFIENIAAATSKFINVSDEIIYNYQAFFARANINLNEKYIINLTGRRDGSSRFGPNNRFAWFGAVGGAWLFHKEKLFDNNVVLSFGKIRASYGTSGNDQIGDYQYLDTYSNAGRSYDGLNGLNPTRIYNPNFSWELNRKLEIAVETGFFKDKLMLTAAYYRNRSSNQLIGIQLPRTTGFTSVNANLAATVQNTGWEFTVNSNNLSTEKFSWTTSLNLSIARNKLIAFPGLQGSTYTNTFVIGKSINIAKFYQFEGVSSQDGLYTFHDFNGDGVISDPDRQHVTDLTPKFFGGLENQIQYKGIQFNFLFQFVKQQNYAYMFAAPGSFSNTSMDVLDRWQSPGDISRYQMYTSGTNRKAIQANNNYNTSNGVIVDGSYIRLKNIALSYELPLKRETVKCRINLQGQNLMTFTSYKNGDPEFKYDGFLPPLRTYLLGLQLTF